MEPSRSRLAAIDGLRGAAIIGVLVHHLLYSTTPPGWLTLDTPFGAFPIGAPLAHSWLAVNLFFALSGFVIYLPYALNERRFATSNDIVAFFRSRAKRLLPLFYVVAFFSVFIGESLSDVTLWRELALLMSGLFVFSPTMWMPPQNIVLWSLGAELWMSAFFPFLAFSFLKCGPLRTTAIVALFSLIVRAIATWLLPGEFQVNEYLDRLADSFAGRLDDFAVGMLVAHLWATRQVDRIRVHGTGIFTLGLAMMFIATVLWDYVLLGVIPRRYTCLINTLVGAASFALIAGSLSVSGGVIQRFLTSRMLGIIGAACYSIYVWHLLIQHAVLPRIAHHSLSWADVPMVAAYLMVVTIVAFVSYRLIERCPLLR